MADLAGFVTVGLVVAGLVAMAGLIVSWLIVLADVVGPLTDAAQGAIGISQRQDRQGPDRPGASSR
jgi:hypothetical protein